MAKLSLTQLERHLLAASDILRREGMEAATYKDFIFGMLFLKRCSDVWGDGQARGAGCAKKHVESQREDRARGLGAGERSGEGAGKHNRPSEGQRNGASKGQPNGESEGEPSGASEGEHNGASEGLRSIRAASTRAAGSRAQLPSGSDGLRVPECARWDFLVGKLSDSSGPYGAVLDKALRALTDSNACLEHVLDHIRFMKVQGNKRIVSDEACRELVRHFGRHRLKDEDFPFSDVMGAAYEFLISLFAESAGKKAGDFYTPREVIRLLVRILDPSSNMSVYDPTCGSGGMLILSREYVEQSGGDPAGLRLYGQVNDPSAWSLAKLNMLLRGVPDADIQLADTLLHPMHRDGRGLQQFDRVIANPPFSQNYTRADMEFPERFRWGWCATSGKKADLMFAQHMLAVCKADGVVAAVMPLGVLFRGGAEQEIRRKLLEQDLIEAVIGLPHNLFYGAGIPACVLVMRPNPAEQPLNPGKPAARRGKVLFINADAEFEAGRAQNRLRPEHVEKIVATFQLYQDVPAYARVVPIAELTGKSNDCNLNIRRYVDNSPPPERHDVRAHLLGGVPAEELADRRELFDEMGFDPARAFVQRGAPLADAPSAAAVTSPLLPPETATNIGGQARADRSPGGTQAPPNNAAPWADFHRDSGYLDFVPTLAERTAIRKLVESDAGVQATFLRTQQSCAAWWMANSYRLSDLTHHHGLNVVRCGLIDTFTDCLLTSAHPPPLDRFKLAGVVANWWADHLSALKTLRASGYAGVIEYWLDEMTDAIEGNDASGPAVDVFRHPLARQVLPHDREDPAASRSVRASSRASNVEALKMLRSSCRVMHEDDKHSLVLLILGQAIQARVHDALCEKRQALAGFMEQLWDKYRITLTDLRSQRAHVEAMLDEILMQLAYR